MNWPGNLLSAAVWGGVGYLAATKAIAKKKAGKAKANKIFGKPKFYTSRSTYVGLGGLKIGTEKRHPKPNRRRRLGRKGKRA
jgi:hypothetical protein